MKPVKPEPAPLLAILFGTEATARASEEYERALAEGRAGQAGESIASESEQRREGEPKCWIN
jgi:hypothetical protein